MEIKMIIFLATLQYIGYLITNKKSDTLSCGIFGWAGKSIKQFDKAKFDIQGLYNNSRGGDSCGVTTDGEIYYGVGVSKHYSDFLIKNNYQLPKNYPVVIGHTRKSSSGAINGDNAHPFGFGNNNEGFEFIGVHNGTLHNQHELAKTYDVESSVYAMSKYNINTFQRSKNDSEILLECIYKSNNFKVLSEYNGGAALLFTNTLEPNVIYAYRGASKMEKNGVDTLYEERPLYYYVENKNSVYFSSLEESLVAIGGDPIDSIFELDCNTVYKIKDGNILHATKFILSRKNAHQRPYYSYTKFNGKVYENKKETVVQLPSLKNKNLDDDLNIHNEEVERFYKSPIYMHRLRYWRNGHLISGIYTWINEYGFKYLTSNSNNIIKETERLIDKPFNLSTGDFIMHTEIDDSNEDIIYPFNTTNGVRPSVLYFNEGVLLETELDFLALQVGTKKVFSVHDLSMMSKHPVVSLATKTVSSLHQNIMLKGEFYTGTICPLGSNKIFNIVEGNLINCRIINTTLKPVVNNVSKVDKNEVNISSQFLLPLESKEIKTSTTIPINLNKIEEITYNDVVDDNLTDEQVKNFIKKPAVEESCECTFINPNLAKKAVDNMMVPIYEMIQDSNVELEIHKDIPFIKDILEANEDYLITLDEIITNTYK